MEAVELVDVVCLVSEGFPKYDPASSPSLYIAL